MLRAWGLTRTYPGPGSDVTALADVSLSVAAGEVVAVTGRSGSGKSTLLRILAGVDVATSGGYSVAGEDVTTGRQRRALRRGRVALVFQDYNLIAELTALENVEVACRLGRREGARQRSVDALDRMGLAALQGRWPHQLSGGEQQRVALARALAVGSDVLLADEPTGSLDEESAVAVCGAFRRVAGDGTAVLVATHDPVVSERADRALRLDAGRLVAP